MLVLLFFGVVQGDLRGNMSGYDQFFGDFYLFGWGVGVVLRLFFQI